MNYSVFMVQEHVHYRVFADDMPYNIESDPVTSE